MKDAVYNFFVRKNENVRYEYERYVMEHTKEHYEHRFLHWKILLKLNIHYRVKKVKSPMIYFDDSGDGIGRNAGSAITEDAGKETKPAASGAAIDGAQLSCARAGSGEVCLRWEAEADICNIYRSGNGTDYKFVSKVFGDRIYIDDTVKADTKYEYKIKVSKNEKNYSRFSNVVRVKTLPLGKYELIYGTAKLCGKGAESEACRRMSEMNLAKMLMKYDVISFDVFDTLLLRPFRKPSDLLMLVGQKLDIMDYCSIRLQAEEDARKYNMLTRGNREVTLEEIYANVEKQTGVPKEYGMQAELETEFGLCKANPYMQRVYRLVKHQKKKVIALSDMYLCKDTMGELLAANGYGDLDDILVSCDYNVSKAQGGLYDILISRHGKEPGRKIIHIGDNARTDIERAREKGLEAYHYIAVNEAGDKYRASKMSRLVGSAYAGIVNAHLHNGIHRFSPYYEVGFVYAGIYVMGFCCWLHKKAVENHITKILFLAREGDIYRKVFKRLFRDVETEYVLWSRVPVAKTVVRKNRHPYLLQLVHHKAHAIYKSKVGRLFDCIGIGELKKYFPEYKIREEEFLSSSNEKIVESLLTDHWEEVCGCYEEDGMRIREYLESMVSGHSRAAAVDVGWSGNNVLQVKYLIEEVYQSDCRIYCYLAAAREVNDTYMASMMQSGEVETYIFSNLQNRGLHDFHQETNERLNSFFFEILTQSCTPTFLGFDGDNFLYDIPEVENFGHNKEIHRGILDFARIYAETFREYPYMKDISGHDAYMPFRLFVSDLSWLRKYFPEYVFGRDLFATQEKAVMETVKEVMQAKNL